jgi:DNA-directed RNA polymerase subunit L
MDLRKVILEVLDTTVSNYKIKVHPYSDNISVYFAVDKERYELNFRRDVHVNELVTIDFERWAGEEEGWNMSSPRGSEHNPAKILGAIVNSIKMVLQKFSNIHYITFNTNEVNDSRVRLYNSIVNRAISQGLVKQADRNSEMYGEIIKNYPKAWVLEVIR